MARSSFAINSIPFRMKSLLVIKRFMGRFGGTVLLKARAPMKIVVEHLENLIRIPSGSSLQEAHCSPFSDVGTNQPKSPKNPKACYELRSQWDCIPASLGGTPPGGGVTPPGGYLTAS